MIMRLLTCVAQFRQQHRRSPSFCGPERPLGRIYTTALAETRQAAQGRMETAGLKIRNHA